MIFNKVKFFFNLLNDVVSDIMNSELFNCKLDEETESNKNDNLV